MHFCFVLAVLWFNSILASLHLHFHTAWNFQVWILCRPPCCLLLSVMLPLHHTHPDHHCPQIKVLSRMYTCAHLIWQILQITPILLTTSNTAGMIPCQEEFWTEGFLLQPAPLSFYLPSSSATPFSLLQSPLDAADTNSMFKVLQIKKDRITYTWPKIDEIRAKIKGLSRNYLIVDTGGWVSPKGPGPDICHFFYTGSIFKFQIFRPVNTFSAPNVRKGRADIFEQLFHRGFKE